MTFSWILKNLSAGRWSIVVLNGSRIPTHHIGDNNGSHTTLHISPVAAHWASIKAGLSAGAWGKLHTVEGKKRKGKEDSFFGIGRVWTPWVLSSCNTQNLLWCVGSFHHGQQSGAHRGLLLHNYSSRSCLPGESHQQIAAFKSGFHYPSWRPELTARQLV